MSYNTYAGKLWNILPDSVTLATQLDMFKILLGKFLHEITDKPPVKGYHTTQNRNSLIDWFHQSGGLQYVWWPC